jgi:hypothetical protein
MLIFGICYDLLKTPCTALQKERCICKTMSTQLWGKTANLTHLMVESAMGENDGLEILYQIAFLSRTYHSKL